MPTDLAHPDQPTGRDSCPIAAELHPPDQEHHSVFCPTCSSRLAESRCKLICKTCGYFLSCADFY
jgi:hypothetical protein